MRTTTGITTNAIYGSTTMLLKVLEEEPHFIVLPFDRPEPTFRHKEYKEYKATREKASPTLHEQMPYIKEVEMPLVEVLVEMESNGVSIDTPLLKNLGKEIEQELKDLETHIFAIAGETFNINSPRQLAHILFEKLMLPATKKKSFYKHRSFRRAGIAEI